jgi:hypothetical protein
MRAPASKPLVVLSLCLAACGSGSPSEAGPGEPCDAAAGDGAPAAPVDLDAAVDSMMASVDGVATANAIDAPVGSVGDGRLCGPGGACGPGGCCVAGTCVADGEACGVLSGQCHQGSCGDCGGVGQACCHGFACTERATECDNGMCVRCGTEPGERCCRIDPVPTLCLGDDLVCGPLRSCTGCGQPGTPCCPGSKCAGAACCYGDTCVASGTACGGGATAGGTCDQGRCSACGGLGQPCCQFVCSEPQTRCMGVLPDLSGGHCARCGHPGEPCCGQGPEACVVGAACTGSGCAPCGGEGQPCCPGDTCRSGGCCSLERCVADGQTCGDGSQCQSGQCACGKLGEACCSLTADTPVACTDPNTACTGGVHGRTCVRCGAPSQPCCPGNRCDGGCCVNAQVPPERFAICVAAGTSCAPPVVPPFIADGGAGYADGDAAAGGTAGPPPGPICTTGGACGACGGLGQPCCQDGTSWCSAAGTTCLSDGQALTCQPCGRPGQPCCSSFGYGSIGGGSCVPPAACVWSGGIPSCQTPSPAGLPVHPDAGQPVRT